VQYFTAPLMALIGFAPILPLAIAREYARSFMCVLIEPGFGAFCLVLAPSLLLTFFGRQLVRPVLATWDICSEKRRDLCQDYRPPLLPCHHKETRVQKMENRQASAQ